jgi:hypothetical protein
MTVAGSPINRRIGNARWIFSFFSMPCASRTKVYAPDHGFMASDEPVDLPVINGPIDLAGLAVSLARVGGWNHGVFDSQQQYTDRQSAGQIPGAQTASDAHPARRIAWKERRQLIWKVTQSDRLSFSTLFEVKISTLFNVVARCEEWNSPECGTWLKPRGRTKRKDDAAGLEENSPDLSGRNQKRFQRQISL